MLQRLIRLPYLAFFLAPIVMLAPVLLPGKALFWGTPMLQFAPWRVWAWDVFKAGQLPIWNPLVGMGAPLVANYQSGLFYPPNWFYFLLAAAGGPAGLAWGQGWLVAAHLIWAALGMGFLARRLGLGVLAQTVSGLAFGLSGYLVARAGFLSINAAVAWLPWLILGLTRRKFSLYSTVTLALCIGMLLLAGHAQTAWYSLLLAAAWSAFWVSTGYKFSRRLEPGNPAGNRIQAMAGDIVRWLARAWGPLAIATGLGMLLAAVQLLPTAEYLVQSQRAAAVDYESTVTYSFWPWRFLGLFAPGFFGSPASGDYWGYGNFWEDAIYTGLLPVTLALAAIWKGRSAPEEGRTHDEGIPHKRGIIAFLGVTILVSFLLALGDNLPVFPWMYRNVPTFDMFQSPTRFTLWMVFALATLAGIGVQAWRRPAGRGLYWARLGTAAAAAVTIGAGITAFAAPMGLGQINPTSIRAFASAGLWGLGIGVLTLSMPSRVTALNGPGESSWWPWAVAGLVSADLVVAGWGLNPAVDIEVYRRDLPAEAQVRSMVGDGRIYLPAEDEEQLKFQRFLRFDSFSPEEDWEKLRATLLPDANMFAGIPSVNNFDPLVPGRYAHWMEALEKAGDPTRERMLDLMAATVVERVDQTSPGGVRFESRPALPRIRWVGCGLAARLPENTLEWVLQGSNDLGQQVILEASPESLSTHCIEGQPGVAGTIELLSENPNRLFMAVESSQAGYLVIADVWYPGWEARIDGDPTPVLRANYLFRAVSIPAGEHRVELVYHPLAFYLGAMLSTLAWAGIAFFYVFYIRAGQPVLSKQSSIQ